MKHVKQVASAFIILTTVGLFLYTWRTHPDLFRQLGHVRPWVIVAVLALYGLMTLLLVLIYDTTLRLCGHVLSYKEQTLLTMYSSIVNFFGPLQSGPGVRTVYLKKKHNVAIKKYAAATVVYYLFFACFSGLFLLSGIRPLWLGLLLSIVIGSVGLFMVWAMRRRLSRFAFVQHFSPTLLLRLACLSLVQVLLVTGIYFVELRATGAAVSVGQTIVYTGAANFSLFVSLTPGGLGFREAFLLFSRDLHHIPSGTILSANVLDRGAYIVFLGILFLLVLGFHAHKKFSISESEAVR